MLRSRLMDMPFIQSRTTHGDSLPAETHPAFHIGFSAHMEGARLGIPHAESGNDPGIDPGTDEHLRAVILIP